MLALSSPTARRSRSSSRTSSTTRPKLAFMHFYEPAPDARARLAGRGRRGQEGTLSARAPQPRSRARSSAPPRRRRRSAARIRIGIPRVLNIYSTAPVLAHVLRGARHPEAERRLLRRRRPKRCGSRAASTARSIPATRPRSRRRTSTTCSSHHHTEEEAAQLHLLPDPHARADVRHRHDGQRELPHRRRRAGRHEGGVHEGGRLLRRRAASSTSIRRSRSSSRP